MPPDGTFNSPEGPQLETKLYSYPPFITPPLQQPTCSATFQVNSVTFTQIIYETQVRATKWEKG